MKIAYLAPEFYPPWGGVGTYSVNLVKELSKFRNMDIHVFTPERGKDYNKKDIEKFFGNRITIHNISKANDTFMYNFYFQYALLKKFKEYYRKHKYDLVHSANLVHMPDIFLKFGKQPYPSVVTGHTTIRGQVAGFLQSNKNFFKMAPSEKGSIVLYPLINQLEKIYLKNTPNLISPSKKFAKIFKEKGYKGRIEVINYGIDTDLFNYKKIRNPYEKFPQFKNIDKTKILYAGRLISQKGIDIFVRLMHELIEEKRNVHFIIAGQGDEKNLFRLIRDYNIPKESYTFLGFVQNHDLPGLYKLSDIFVLPSYYENFPISLMEAMSMRCVCIATDVGAVTELIEDSRNGIVAEAGDLLSIKRSIYKLIDNTTLRIRLAKKGENKIKKELTNKQMAHKTKKFYNEMIK
jgi:glycosyltransferase involved in cell wall biosynthesis